jgi:hypothetical protein
VSCTYYGVSYTCAIHLQIECGFVTSFVFSNVTCLTSQNLNGNMSLVFVDYIL